MKHITLIIVLLGFSICGMAQSHIKQYVDNMVAAHPEMLINYKSEAGSLSPNSNTTQATNIYTLSVTPNILDNLKTTFEAEKKGCYSYIRTSARYNQLNDKKKTKLVTLQNGEFLNCNSTEYSFVTISAIDQNNDRYRTNYILIWFEPDSEKVEAMIYILYGPRPNNL